ncbi:YopX family protein [Bacillus toyonensis]|uniref:YopX family protein n=1 Tax=Bacillus toyonensis TaxID=155322 RepID=UPI001F0B1797|nr:YopX family protein [Bacillus toyonensis]
MREIKFRAFDKVSGKMYDVGYIDFANEVVQVAMIKYGICYGTYVRRLKDVVLLQSAGLKDKNGKEIYEGGIVKVPEYYEHQENQTMTYFNWEVTYENCAFRLDGISMEEDYEWISEECEVIGNKFENPELLQGGNR